MDWSEEHYHVQDTTPTVCGESTTGWRSQCVLLSILKRPDWHPAPTLICTSHIHLPPPATPPPPSPTTLPAFKVCVEDVNRVFRKQKSRKASGPDGISPACLKVCADQLAPIFTQIFNRSQELCEVPCCFKRSTIIPVPKKPKITGLNDYLRDWSWPTWRTSLDPCWILFSLPTEQTGLWMTLSIWDCITSCNTSTNLGIT